MNMWTFWQPVMNVLMCPTKEEQNTEMNMWMFWQPVMNVLLYPAPPPGLLGRPERGATPSPDLPLLTYPELYTPWLVGINICYSSKYGNKI